MTPHAKVSRPSTTSLPGDLNMNGPGRAHQPPVSHVHDRASRVPPHDPGRDDDLQRTVLVDGHYVMARGTTVLESVVATGLLPDHFYAPAHQRIWQAVLDLRDAGEPVDLHTVAARCGSRQDVTAVIRASDGIVCQHAPAWAVLVISDARCRAALPDCESAVDALYAGRRVEACQLLERALAEVAS